MEGMEPSLSPSEAQLTTFVIKQYFPNAVTVKRYHFEQLLDQITPQYLESFIKYIRQNQCDPFCHTGMVPYCLKQDLCILSLLKLNQHKLCEEALNLIYLQLTKIIPKSYKAIKKRHESLGHLDINHLLKAVQMDFDIVLGLELDTVHSWVQQWKKEHVLTRADIIVRRMGHSTKFFVAVSNARRSLNKMINSQANFQKNQLSKEDKKTIDKIYTKIIKRKQYQTNFTAPNRGKLQQNIVRPQKLDSLHSNPKNQVQDRVLQYCLDENEIRKVKAKLKNLLQICYLSPIINRKQSIHRHFRFIDNKTQKFRHTTLNLVFRKCKRMWQRIVSSVQELDRLKDWSEILIQLIHTINRQNQEKEKQHVNDQSLVEIVVSENNKTPEQIRITKNQALKSTQAQIEKIFQKIRLKRSKSHLRVIQL